MKKLIFLNEIAFKDSPRVRSGIRNEVAEDYARRYRAKESLPPVHLFWDSGAKLMYLADGSHRCAAMALIGRKAIEAEVRNGTYQDALQFALLANAQHGLPRSNEDKRQSIATALQEWPKVSNVQISKMCDVDDKTVALVRAELETKQLVAPSKTRISAAGKQMPAVLPRKSEVGIREKTSKTTKSPKTKEPIDLDAKGTPIPKAVQKYWNRAPEVRELMASISEIVKQIKKAHSSQDLMFAEISCNTVVDDLERAYTAIKCSLPYVVCALCQGHPETQKAGCRMCFGRGLIGKFRYDRVPVEIKKLKEAGK